MVAGVALSQTVQMAETVNQMAERVSNALNVQNNLNGQPISGSGSGASGLSLDFTTVNHAICVTHCTVLHASTTVMKFNHHMRGVWNTAFLNFTT